MRNKLIHGYLTVEMSVVWNTAINDIPNLHNFCNDILKNNQNQNENNDNDKPNPPRFRP
jgi:uncharacterized protein with HEPN domain